MPDALQKLIEKRLKAVGKSARKASLDAGLGTDGIRNVFRGQSRTLRGDRVYKLARVLEISPKVLIRAMHPGLPEEEFVPDSAVGVESPERSSGMRVLGEAAAGNWSEHLDWDESRQGYVPTIPDPRFSHEYQFVIRVRGDSINKVAKDGEYLLCVQIGEMPLSDNDLVVVERTRRDAGEREITVKRAKKGVAGKYELWPESNNERYQEPISFSDGTDQSDENVTVTILGIAIWKLGYIGPGTFVNPHL